ncbi:MAG TPA: 4a-hydroxytetrahydrobiopterin dehydratase [Thermoanaerobaculia bacterium]
MTNTQINDVQGASVTKRKRRPPGSLQKLKSERVQQAVAQMPGWRVSDDGQALERLRVFRTYKMAASFIAFVAHNAAEADQAVDIRVVRREVALTLRGTCRTGLPSILTERTLQFAKGVA